MKTIKYNIKIIGLIIMIVSFSFIYILLDNSHFEGINPVQDKIKEVILEKEVKENFNIEKDKMKKNIEEVVKSDDEKLKKPSIFQNLFDRMYFSIITACLLGYGDIYPATNTLKVLTSVQSFLTVCLILY